MNITEEAKAKIFGMENLEKIAVNGYYNLHDSSILSLNFDAEAEKVDLAILIFDNPQFVPHPNLQIPQGQEAIIHFYFDGVQKAEFCIEDLCTMYGFEVTMVDYYPSRYLQCSFDSLDLTVIAESMSVSPIVFRPIKP